MFNPLKGLGDIKKMRDQAMAMQRALSLEEVVVEQNGIRVVMSGDQKIKELVIDGAQDNRVMNAIQEAIRRSQEIAARKLTEMSGGLSGLMGGGQ